MADVKVKKPRREYKKLDKKIVSEETKKLFNYFIDGTGVSTVTDQPRRRPSDTKISDNTEKKKAKIDSPGNKRSHRPTVETDSPHASDDNVDAGSPRTESDGNGNHGNHVTTGFGTHRPPGVAVNSKEPSSVTPSQKTSAVTDLTSPTSATGISLLNLESHSCDLHDDDDGETLDSLDGPSLHSHLPLDNPGPDDDELDGDGPFIPYDQLSLEEQDKRVRKVADRLRKAGDSLNAGGKIDDFSASFKALIKDLTYEKFRETMTQCIGNEPDVRNLIAMFQLTKCFIQTAANTSIVTQIKTLAFNYFEEQYAVWLGDLGGLDYIADVISG